MEKIVNEILDELLPMLGLDPNMGLARPIAQSYLTDKLNQYLPDRASEVGVQPEVIHQVADDGTFEAWSAIREDGRQGKLLIDRTLYETKQKVLGDLDPMKSSDWRGEFEIIKIKYTVDEIYKI